MRISVCNWRTTEADVARTVALLRGILEGLPFAADACQGVASD